MKKIVLLLVATSFLMVGYAEARGGGGGRGGGGRSMNRSPSMSRSSFSGNPSRSYNRPSNMQTRSVQRPENRPSDINRGQFANQGARQGQRPAASNASRDQVKQFLSNRPEGGQRDLGNRANTQERLQNRDNRQDRRSDWGNHVRNDVYNHHPDHNNWFHDNFWNQHGWYPGYWNHNGNWWGVATAAGIGAWLGWNRTPYYYGYGDDWYYPYYGSSSSSQESYSQGYSQGYTQGSQQQASSSSAQPVQQTGGPSYLESNQQIESASPAGETASGDWLPLGVFALSKDGDTQATPNIYLQLALSKSGTIAGTYYNSTTDQTYETEGAVDEKTGRAAWKIANNENSPIIETGLYNLTEDQAPARVNFPDGRVQQMTLVRLKQQESKPAP
ncbi:hypothetical protein [Estrella lausannensis]|uniref:Putative membrane protein n=1 Tax=Estrella lausannensis TaxID=483423 RepID=A0A0H5DNQ3_9BACT|nr:hypothetical protein [Estrella lausannensis]CRX38011.1 putative membrane protein [Estrella lausannensis]